LSKPSISIRAGECGYVACSQFDEADINDPAAWAKVAELLRQEVQALNDAYRTKYGVSIFH